MSILEEEYSQELNNPPKMVHRSTIEGIDRNELRTEIGVLQISKSNPYPKYLKAVRVSLITLGYDEEWVETTFKKALDKKYLTVRRKRKN